MVLVKGFQKLTLLDYPGKISCTIFVAGCNFHCPFCQNKDLILPELAKNLKTYKEKEIIDFLEKRKGKLEAVCITGGEPTIYNDLPEFIKKIKALEYLVKLDTNGTNPEMVEELLNNHFLDYVAMDYKGPLSKYLEIIQNSKFKIQNYNLKVKNNIKKTIKILLKSGINFELRTTVVPTLHTKADLLKMAREMKSIIHDSKFMIHISWFLQQFRPKNCLDPEFDKIEPYDKRWFNEVLKEVKKHIATTYLRGVV